jgi:hypothetical protein
MKQEDLSKLFELTEKQILEFYRFPEDYNLRVVRKSKQLSVNKQTGQVHLVLECICDTDNPTKIVDGEGF